MQPKLSLPRLLLHAEGLAVFIAAVAVYFGEVKGGWLLFALLILAPDLSALGYLTGVRVGSIAYNSVHTYVLPAILLAFGVLLAAPLAVNLALIWFAHIGMDRALGFGLKYPTEFKDTHLNRV